MPAGSAVERWRDMVLAQQAQSDRLRERSAPPDRSFAPPSVESFRADRERADDARVLDALSRLVATDGTVVDVGAGAGRFAIPLARRVARVIAVEPSETMRHTRESDAQRSGIRNIDVVASRWEQADGVT